MIIAALAESNRVIGKNGHLPWHLPADLKRFKQLTLGHTVVMGRRTWQSLPQALEQRHNIVVSSRLSPREAVTVPRDRYCGDASPTRLDIVPSLEAAYGRASTPRIFIIGGATLYAQTLLDADRLELTLVEGHYDGDVYFPPYRTLLNQSFQRVYCEQHDGFRFETHCRVH